MISSIHPTDPHTAFAGHRILAAGALADVALAVKRALATRSNDPILVFDDLSGKQVDLDLRGDDAAVAERHRAPADAAPPAPEAPDAAAEETQPRGRGRPKLGVVAREVTLLPRHWDWLAAQPGGASVVLRKLVEQARRDNESADRRRQRQEAAYRFMSAMAGNLPGFEEATRALYAEDRERFAAQVASWPQDVRGYALGLAWPDEG
ncbi:DUF2239 family protein [Achromobacter denitrificans]|uniref:DUF2239 family protein n=1 Tax=Achromobacter denitrificans TaxID=32002 RepID=UPI00240E6028|nr:DUF2239 family protein [Achromobacter denitrificans]MBV2161037.1 DUF2239 family protein [Achromobacter denitrificans]MDX3879685.1 DUF2239 family protein [Achromobacter sp.]WFC65025.1 DUF2239 family protein [Achromobacter denitrificans]